MCTVIVCIYGVYVESWCILCTVCTRETQTAETTTNKPGSDSDLCILDIVTS